MCGGVVHSIVEGSEVCMWTILNGLPHSYVWLTMHSKFAFIHKPGVCISRGRELSYARLGSGSLGTCAAYMYSFGRCDLCLSSHATHSYSSHTHTHASSFTYRSSTSPFSLLLLSHDTLKSTQFQLALLIKAMSGVFPTYAQERPVQQLCTWQSHTHVVHKQHWHIISKCFLIAVRRWMYWHVYYVQYWCSTKSLSLIQKRKLIWTRGR
jgi:hypothetical protein